MGLISLIIVLPVVFKLLWDYEPDIVKFKRIKEGRKRTDNKYALYLTGAVLIIFYIVKGF